MNENTLHILHDYCATELSHFLSQHQNIKVTLVSLNDNNYCSTLQCNSRTRQSRLLKDLGLIVIGISIDELKASIRQGKIDYLKSAMAKAKSCPKMAAQMWARVNSVLG